MRLIDADAVEKITWQDPSYTDPLNVLTEVREKVRALPTIDAVPISFMEEMKAWAEENGFDMLFANDIAFLLSAWAERKEE